jgi:hypothetical protein
MQLYDAAVKHICLQGYKTAAQGKRLADQAIVMCDDGTELVADHATLYAVTLLSSSSCFNPCNLHPSLTASIFKCVCLLCLHFIYIASIGGYILVAPWMGASYSLSSYLGCVANRVKTPRSQRCKHTSAILCLQASSTLTLQFNMCRSVFCLDTQITH